MWTIHIFILILDDYDVKNDLFGITWMAVNTVGQFLNDFNIVCWEKEQKNMMCVMFLCSGDFDMDTRTFADFNIVWWGKVKNMMCLMFLCSDDISRPQHSLLEVVHKEYDVCVKILI